MAKRNRSELKSFFIKNSIPTESNFADLVDSMMNQQEDGLVKQSGDPLRINAEDNQGLQKLINFYETMTADKAAWSLQMNPRADGINVNKARPGFCVADGQTNIPRLFIDKATGNIGINTISPIAPLDISQILRNGTHPKAVKGLYITGDFAPDSDGVEFRHTNGSQGIGFGYNTIYATGSNDDQVLQLKPRGAAALRVLGKANISDGSNLEAIEKQMANGSLTIGSITSSYGGGKDWNTNTAGLMLQTQSNTEIAVHDSMTRLTSLMYYEGDTVNRITIGRDMGAGWGVTPVSIAGSFFAGNSDIYFSKTDHNHTGLGNATGMAAIENSAQHQSLMILGRTIGNEKIGYDRRVQVWDTLEVKGKFVNNSDRNAKKDIEDLQYGLVALRNLRPVSFNWKELYNPHKSLGLIAQEVQEIISEIVYEDDSDARKGALSISYISLIPVLINAIKELDAKINP